MQFRLALVGILTAAWTGCAASLPPAAPTATPRPADMRADGEDAASLPPAALTATPRLADMRADGAELIFRPEAPASAQNPAFSPGGETLLFTLFHEGYNDGPAGLYLLDFAGEEPRALLDEPDQDSVNLPGTSWNAETGLIVFSSDREDTHEIWIIGEDGGGLTRLTFHEPPSYYMEPSFSPDGEWIVFEIAQGGDDETQHGSLWKVRRDGTDLTELSNGWDDRQPNWSPRGDRILFQRRNPGSENWDLYTMATDGSDLRQITDDPASDTDASWSPDGGWIVYSSDTGGLPAPNLFVIPAEGGTPIRVTFDDTHEDSAPSWSPDGAWIVFETHPFQDEETPASLRRIAAPDITVQGRGL